MPSSLFRRVVSCMNVLHRQRISGGVCIGGVLWHSVLFVWDGLLILNMDVPRTTVHSVHGGMSQNISVSG